MTHPRDRKCRIIKIETLVTRYDIVDEDEGTDEEIQERLLDAWVEQAEDELIHFHENTKVTSELGGQVFSGYKEAKEAKRKHKLGW